MRTTLTLDKDVAVLLERAQKSRKASLKAMVNEALRIGLSHMAKPVAHRQPYRTPGVSLGRCLAGNLDDVADVLAVAEGEWFQ